MIAKEFYNIVLSTQPTLEQKFDSERMLQPKCDSTFSSAKYLEREANSRLFQPSHIHTSKVLTATTAKLWKLYHCSIYLIYFWKLQYK